MSRNSQGDYTLPASVNPVVSGTTITDEWANTTMADIAQSLTDSLDRQGRGGMSGAFKVTDGTVSAPGLAFTNEASSGFYRSAAGVVRFGILGVEKMKIEASAITFAVPLAIPTGNLTITRQTAGSMLYLIGANTSEASSINFASASGDSVNTTYQDVNWDAGKGRFDHRIASANVASMVDNGSAGRWFEIKASAPATMEGGQASSLRNVAFRFISNTQVALQMLGDDGVTRSVTLTLS